MTPPGTDAWPTLAVNGLSGAMFAVGVAIIAMSVWWSLRKKLLSRARADDETPRERLDRIAGREETSRTPARNPARDHAESYMVDAEELTRRLAAHLDNKADRVESLLDRAEARIAELETRLRDAGLHPDDDWAATRTASARATVGAGATDRPSAGADLHHEPDPVAAQVYTLADEGLEPLQIAQRTGEHVGKVELILALRA